MTKKEICLKWLEEASEAYKVLTNGIQWGYGWKDAVESCDFTDGIHLSAWNNGESPRKLAEIAGLEIKVNVGRYYGEHDEVYFEFNDVKFHWLEKTKKETADAE